MDSKKGNYRISGVYEKKDENTVEITELPVGTWTQSYKELLEALVAGTDKAEAIVKVGFDEKVLVILCLQDYKEHHTDTTVHFTVEFLEGKLKELEESGTL